MGRPGVVAFPVLLILGAITGYLTYDMLVIQSTPVEGIYDGSPYRKDLPAPERQNSASAQDTSSEQLPIEDPTTGEESSVITISILKGSSVSGAPDYDPDHAIVPLGATIRWVNEDSLPHSATSGSDVTDTVFDTGLFTAGEKSIAASDIGTGEYTYFCIAHPFMVGTLTIE